MRKVLVAVSGGVDSVVLLDRLVKQGEDVGVAHVHHGLREASDEEYEFVARLASSYQVPFHGKRLTFPNGGSQATYRKERYQFFAEIMDVYGYEEVATAHHADDELETVLIQLHRNVTEVKGIPAQRPFGKGLLVRPLLGETKNDLLKYALTHGLEWREDVTNKERTYLRNVIRHDIVPQLLNVWPNVVSEVGEVARIQRRDWDKRYEESERWIGQYVELGMKAFHVKLDDYARLDSLLRYTVNRLLSIRYGVEINEAMNRLLASKKDTGTYDLAENWMVSKQNRVLHLLKCPKQEVPPIEVIEHLPASIQFGNRTVSIYVETGSEGIPLDSLQFPLTIRTAMPGDRIRLRVGTKKVSRIFIDEKIDRKIRPFVPVLVDATGQVIAIVGIRVSEFLDKSDANCPRLMVK